MVASTTIPINKTIVIAPNAITVSLHSCDSVMIPLLNYSVAYFKNRLVFPGLQPTGKRVGCAMIVTTYRVILERTI
jgi:hypothetical protein